MKRKFSYYTYIEQIHILVRDNKYMLDVYIRKMKNTNRKKTFKSLFFSFRDENRGRIRRSMKTIRKDFTIPCNGFMFKLAMSLMYDSCVKYEEL